MADKSQVRVAPTGIKAHQHDLTGTQIRGMSFIVGTQLAIVCGMSIAATSLKAVPPTPSGPADATASNAGSSVPRLAFTVREAAQSVGLSYRTLLDLIAKGEINAVPAGRHKLITVRELWRWLDENPDAGIPAAPPPPPAPVD